MKEIVITNKSGITLPTKKTLVDDDIKIKIDKSLVGIDGVSVDVGPLSDEDLIIDGKKIPTNNVVLSGLNGKLYCIGADGDEKIDMTISAFTEIKLKDSSGNNLIEAENLTPENIKKDVNILGTIGTFEASGSSEDTLEALCNNTLTSYSNDNLTKIKEGLFKNNKNLQSVDLPNLTKTEYQLFYNCSNLINVNLPKVSSMGGNDFYGCSKLQSIFLPNLTSTQSNAFFNCSVLKTAHLGKIYNVANNIFYNCKALTDIYLGYGGLVNLSNTSAFNGVTAGIKIHVRPEYADRYATATNWSSLIEAGTIVIVGDYSD